MAWRAAVVKCHPHSVPRDYDPELYYMRVRFAQQDEIDIGTYAKKYVGGPGVLWIRTNSSTLKKYEIGEWLKPENYSIPMFIKEANECIRDYLQNILKWNDGKIHDSGPHFLLEKWIYRWQTFEMDRYHLKLHCRKAIDQLEAKALNLQFIADANLAFALNAIGFSFNSSCGHSNRNHSWWEVRSGYLKPTGVLEIPDTFTWNALRKVATYPINNVCTTAWMWDVFYSHDDVFSASERILYYIPEGLSREDQLLGIVKKTLFESWKRLGYIKEYELKFKPNQLNPTIRQMHIQIIAKDYWYRLTFTFSPLLVELFNWNASYLENGNQIVIDHDHRNFLIDMSSYAPPERNALYADLLTQPSQNYYEVIHSTVNPEQAALKVAWPNLMATESRFLEFSYKSDSTEGLNIPTKTSLCASTIASYCNTPKLLFKLDGGMKRAHDLRSINLRIQAHILNRHGISLQAAEKVYASEHTHEKFIKRMKVKIGQYTLLSTDYYHQLLSMLKLLYKAKGTTSTIEREAFFESKMFHLKVDMFQYDEVPPYYIVPKDEITVEVEVNNTAYYVETVDGRETTHYNLRIQDSSISLESAPLTDHIWKSMDYAWRRHAPYYTYNRRKVQFAYVRAGNMRFEEIIFNKNPNAKRFFVGASMTTTRNDHIQFNHCNIISMRLSQGENEVIGKTYLLSHDGSDQSFHVPYANFVNARSKELPEMSMKDYCNGNILFTFYNRHYRQMSTEPIKIEIIFKEVLTENVHIYCMSETEETIVMGANGRIRSTDRLPPSLLTREIRSIAETNDDEEIMRVNNNSTDEYGNIMSFGAVPDLKPKFLTDLNVNINNVAHEVKGVSIQQRSTALQNISKLRPSKTMHEGEKHIDNYPFIAYDKSKFL